MNLPEQSSWTIYFQRTLVTIVVGGIIILVLWAVGLYPSGWSVNLGPVGVEYPTGNPPPSQSNSTIDIGSRVDSTVRNKLDEYEHRIDQMEQRHQEVLDSIRLSTAVQLQNESSQVPEAPSSIGGQENPSDVVSSPEFELDITFGNGGAVHFGNPRSSPQDRRYQNPREQAAKERWDRQMEQAWELGRQKGMNPPPFRQRQQPQPRRRFP